MITIGLQIMTRKINEIYKLIYSHYVFIPNVVDATDSVHIKVP